MPREEIRERRPWKIWDASRIKKRLVLASSLEELHRKGREKIDYSKEETVYLVLETDGTYVDDDEFLKWFPDNTAFLLLRAGESWTKPVQHTSGSTDQNSDGGSLKTYLLPRVVCDALTTLNIYHEPPFWKIVDNQDKITLVLHWNQRSDRGYHPNVKPTYSQDFPNARFDYNNKVPMFASHSLTGASSILKDSVAATISDKEIVDSQPINVKQSAFTASAGATFKSTLRDCNVVSGACSNVVVAHDSQAANHVAISGSSKDPQLLRSSASSAAFQHDLNKCEFHCGSLHDRGRSIQSAECHRHRIHSMSKILKSTHVHFCDDGTNVINDGVESRSSLAASRSQQHQENASGSEMEQDSSNTIEDDFENENSVTTEKLLLLTDQLCNDKHKHLTIFDLGVILERLKTKIIDVHRLEREREDLRCFRWTINATIRGEILRDLGVLYNGNYYSISESPLLSDPLSGFRDDEEERQDSL
ncbi:uncharacterized protein LOC124329109 isoform X2 [Daphnia pulicaria]|uniref:uncharacterized protein LOC124329109 isoform X2 n=1 Tax=Daphnia pulicaria TaxID=35523 RepID=UPI001EEA74CB|nr:uncharacterized protein LOC124329109 isoform X2 [Daphnia pulicaria]